MSPPDAKHRPTAGPGGAPKSSADYFDLSAQIAELAGRLAELERLLRLLGDALDIDLDRLAALDVIERRGLDFTVDWETLELAGIDPTGASS